MDQSNSLSIIINQPWFVEELRSFGHRVVSVGWDETKRFDVLLDKPGISLAKLLSMLPGNFELDRNAGMRR